jgi:hypothetical protein
MSYLLLIFYLAVFVYLIFKLKFFKTSLFSQYVVAVFFLLKFIGGIGVYLVYTHFYDSRISSDIFKYFDDGNIIYSSISYNPVDYLRMVTGIGGDAPHLYKYYDTCCFWIKDFNYGLFNDNRTVIRFNAIVRLFSAGNFHIHTLFMSFISFAGLWGIFKVFENNISNLKELFLKKWLLVFVIFFFPSVYFWTSGVLKEGILMFAFGMLVYHFYGFIETGNRVKHILWVIISVLLLLISKFYILVAALPGLLFVTIISYSGNSKFYLKLFLSVSVFIMVAWFSGKILGIDFPAILAKKQNDFVAYINSLQYVGSKIDIPALKPEFKNIMANSPAAFFRTLFRPTVFEATNMMMLSAALENTLIIILLTGSILFFTVKNLKNPWLWFSLLFVLVLFTLSGLTTPVLGALVRYKTPALPFLGVAIIYLTDFEKIRSKFEVLKNLFLKNR